MLNVDHWLSLTGHDIGNPLADIGRMISHPF
jgi:hypothetical protein